MHEFTHAPDWQWLVIGYLFSGGLAGGLFVMGALLRWAAPDGEKAAARTAFGASFVALIICPIFLILHLGEPTRFWHMLIDVSNGSLTVTKIWSPMPLGSWALLIFGLSASLIALNQFLVRNTTTVTVTAGGGGNFHESNRGVLPLGLENAILIIGFISGAFIAGYTGVLLSVSSQPLWSDTWLLGGLFAASSLAASTGLLVLLLWLFRQPVNGLLERLAEAMFYFVAIELVLVVLMNLTLGSGEHYKGSSGAIHVLSLICEIVAALALAPLALRLKVSFLKPGQLKTLLLLASLLVIVGSLLLRISVVFAPQI